MTRSLVSFALCAALISPAFALGPAEPAALGAAQAFQALSAFKVKSPVRRLLAANAGVELPPAPSGTRQRYIRLRGFVNVWGSASVPPGQSGSVWITVTGNTQLQDDTGRYLSGSVTVSDTSFYTVNGNYVNGWPRPSAMVTLYKGGRYLGTVRVEGSIPVSGYNNGGWINVNGSGWVDGSGWIYEPEEPQAR